MTLCDGAEFYGRDSLVLRTCTDDEGRPLAEGRCPASARAGIEMEHRTCPYPGSRHQHENPYNVSALRQVQQHWPELLALIGSLRRPFLERHGLSALALPDAIQYATALANAPSFLLRRQPDPLPTGRIPASVACLYKMSFGLSGALFCIQLESWMVGDRPPQLSAALVAGFAEYSKLLVGPKQVCAAPQKMILETLETLLEGSDRVQQLPACLAGDEARLFDYAEHVLRLEVAKQLFGIQHELLLTAARAEEPEGLQAWQDAREGWFHEQQCESLMVHRMIAGMETAGRARVFDGLRGLVARGLLAQHVPALSTLGTATAVSTCRTSQRPSALQSILAEFLPAGPPRGILQPLTAAIECESAFLAVASGIQAQIDHVLDPTHSPISFTSRELRHALGPTLLDFVNDTYGTRLAVDADGVADGDRRVWRANR